MEINVRNDCEALIVSVTGRIDTLSSSEFQNQVEELLCREPQRVVLDCCGLEYVSSMGLRSILIIAKKLQKQGGCLTCCALQPMVRSVFDVSGFTTKIPVFDSLDEAAREAK